MSGDQNSPDNLQRLQEAAEDKELWRTGPVWIASQRKLARYVGRPIASFLQVEVSGGVLLLVAVVIALIWANSAWASSYEALWATEIEFRFGDFVLAEDLRHWVNDALMTLFFFVVGLEIKYELVAGELRDPRAASVPILAAIGGMAVPAIIYVVFNGGGDGAAGWGIPMATDIAFALGVVALLGKRIPSAARVFLLTLAIVDDIGAIVVIAIFYTDDLSPVWLGAALLGIGVIAVLRMMRVWSMPLYFGVGAFVWFATFESGVHATIAGVAIGLLTPAMPLLDQGRAQEYLRDHQGDGLDPEEVRRYRFLLGETVPVAERLSHTLHPWSSYVVLPVFALANAGIDLRDGVLGDAVGSTITLGVAIGLVFGKVIGISLASFIGIKTGLGRLPRDTSWTILIGLAAVGGIGFTVSLFITDLAFKGAEVLVADAKVGVLIGSAVAAVVGSAILIMATRKRAET